MKWLFNKQEKSVGQENDRRACIRLDDCHFIRRHGNCPEFRMKMYRQVYCTGHLLEECARLRFCREKECEPSEHMAPTGLIVENYRS